MEELFADFLKTLIYAVACLICIVFFVTNTFSGKNTKVIVDSGLEKGSQLHTIDSIQYIEGDCSVAPDFAVDQVVLYENEQYIIERILADGLDIIKAPIQEGEANDIRWVSRDKMRWVCPANGNNGYWIYMDTNDPDAIYVTVYFDANGGTVIPDRKDVKYGEQIGDMPTPTRPHRGFEGWYSANSGGEKINSTDTVTRMDNYTVYAHWSDLAENGMIFDDTQSGTITYKFGTLEKTYEGATNANGFLSYTFREATDSAGNQVNFISVPDNTKASFLVTMNDENKIYIGTYHILIDVQAQGDATHAPKDVTLYYDLTISPKDITQAPAANTGVLAGTYDFEGSDVEPNKPITIDFGSGAVTLQKDRDYTLSYANNKIEGQSIDPKNATVTVTGKGNYSGTKNENFTVQRKEYPITYNNNNGTGSPAADVKLWGIDKQLSSITPTRTGYTFASWNTIAAGTGTSYAKGASYTQNAILDLYAQWTENDYNIIFNGNGNTSGSQATVQRKYTASYTLPSTTGYVKTNYTFDGWYTEATGGTKVTRIDANTASDRTVYAHWLPNYQCPTSRSPIYGNYTETTGSHGYTNTCSTQWKQSGVCGTHEEDTGEISYRCADHGGCDEINGIGVCVCNPCYICPLTTTVTNTCTVWRCATAITGYNHTYGNTQHEKYGDYQDQCKLVAS